MIYWLVTKFEFYSWLGVSIKPLGLEGYVAISVLSRTQVAALWTSCTCWYSVEGVHSEDHCRRTPASLLIDCITFDTVIQLFLDGFRCCIILWFCWYVLTFDLMVGIFFHKSSMQIWEELIWAISKIIHSKQNAHIVHVLASYEWWGFWVRTFPAYSPPPHANYYIIKNILAVHKAFMTLGYIMYFYL